MSWEWRVFWEVPEEGEGVLGSLGLKRQPLAREVRSDTYIPCTGEVGIKWRRGRQLEVKVMTEKDEKSGAEKWSKVSILITCTTRVARLLPFLVIIIGLSFQILWPENFFLIIMTFTVSNSAC